MRRLDFTLYRSFVALVIVGVVFACLGKFSSAQSSSAWFGTGIPEFAVRQAVIADSDYPSTIGGRGSIDCDILTFTRRTGLALVVVPGIYNEDKASDCFVNTSIGQVGGNGYVNVGGTDYIADVKDQNGIPASYRTFPGSDTYISNASAAPVGAYIWLNSLQRAVMFSHDLTGKITAKFDPTGQQQLADKAGNPLPVMGDNYATSENGQWMLVDSPGRGVLRVNLDTGEVLPFTSSFEYGNGSGAAIRLAISSDGQYAIVASKTYSYFTIFDLSTCAAVPSTITKPVACESRDLNAFIRSKISDMGGVLYARFTTNNLLNLYASYNISTTSVIGQFALAAPGTSLKGMDYLALGDSFSSGEGAHKYEIGTDEKDINMCHLSTVSYPYVIAQTLQLNSFHSVACSGAKTTNVIGGSGISKDKNKTNRDNQYSTPPDSTSLGDWIPGYQKQVNFVAENAPHLVTLSAIGNDLGFDDIVKACAKPGTCYPGLEDQLEILNAIDGKLPVLVSMYKKLKKADADKTAKIYAVGYPQVALSTGNCGLNVHLNQTELVLAASIVSRINQVVKTAAAQAGIHYADIEDALNGYRLCEGTAGIMGMNGLTAGNDIHHILGNESYHPTELGQFLMAQAILGAINTTSTNPTPQPTTTLPAIDKVETGLSKLPVANRTINKKVIAPKGSTTVTGTKARTKIPAFSSGLVPGNTYTTTIDTGATITSVADTQGGLTSDVPIPADGNVHIISITGSDLTSTNIDVTSFITAPPPTTGEIELCISGIDIDQDGQDDACDSVIGPAPVIITTTTPTSTTPTATSPPASATITSTLATITTTPSAPTSSSTSNTNNEPITFIDDSSTQDNPIQSTSPNTSNSSNPTDNQSTQHVLGASTAQPSQLSPALKRLAKTYYAALNLTATAHPLRLLAISLTLIIILLILALLRRRNQKQEIIYVDLAQHSLSV